jgi:hypothetical protein
MDEREREKGKTEERKKRQREREWSRRKLDGEGSRPAGLERSRGCGDNGCPLMSSDTEEWLARVFSRVRGTPPNSLSGPSLSFPTSRTTRARHVFVTLLIYRVLANSSSSLCSSSLLCFMVLVETSSLNIIAHEPSSNTFPADGDETSPCGEANELLVGGCAGQ